MTAVADGLAWVGTACIVALNLPQVWRTCVRGRTAGVPAARAWVAIAVAVVWLAYGLYGGIAVQVVLNAAAIALNAALLGRLATRSTATLLWLGGLGATVAGTVLLHGVGGVLAVGVAGAVTGTGMCLPQLLALRGATGTDGVSAASLHLQAAGGACWLVYGLLRSEAVVWTPNVAVLLTTGWTLVLLRGARAAAGSLPGEAQADGVAHAVEGRGQRQAVVPAHDGALQLARAHAAVDLLDLVAEPVAHDG